ncbi:MAG TPA: hypothetical protein VMS76_20605 [Planctomycetota bacterium]|nr:hypothetical protein [Planctomycetota bacterium]
MTSAQANERLARVELRVLALLLALGLASFLGMAWLLEGRAPGEAAAPRAAVDAMPRAPADATPSAEDLGRPVATPQGARTAQDSPAAPEPPQILASRDGDPLRDPIARAGEREHYGRFARMAAGDPSVLEDQASRVLFGAGPDSEKVALLRALADCGSTETGAWLETAVRRLPDEPSAAAESVPAFALQRLAGRAAADPLARASLERIAFGPGRPAPERLRRQAATALAEHASPGELARMAADLAGEESALLRSSVLEALSRNPDPDAVAAAFGSLPQREDSLHPTQEP